MWNSLPIDFRNTDSKEHFKQNPSKTVITNITLKHSVTRYRFQLSLSGLCANIKLNML